jgi:methylmalonyl-CoA mutase cobalamin-binding subunit
MGPVPTNKFDVDVQQWIADEQLKENAIKLGGTILSAVLVGLCFLPFTGPIAMVALGVIGGVTGVATSAYSFEMAEDLNNVANSQEGGLHSLLSDPDAAQVEYIWAIVNLVIASVGAVLAGYQALKVGSVIGKFSSASAGMKVINQLGTSSRTLNAINKLSQLDDGVLLLSKLENASSATIRNFANILNQVGDDALATLARNTNSLDEIDDLARMNLDDILTHTNRARNSLSNRLSYMGRTPGKTSRTGREVIERMTAEGKIKIVRGETLFKASNGRWYNIKYADMAHKTDAVTWWNSTGRYYGAKASEVRNWMLNSKNYYLEYFSINRSQGASLNITYMPPAAGP